jgi:hypothetical protein
VQDDEVLALCFCHDQQLSFAQVDLYGHIAHQPWAFWALGKWWRGLAPGLRMGWSLPAQPWDKPAMEAAPDDTWVHGHLSHAHGRAVPMCAVYDLDTSWRA